MEESSLAYLKRNHVLFYLEDAVAQLITSDVRRRPPTLPNKEHDSAGARRPSAGLTSKAKTATDFVADYFADV